MTVGAQAIQLSCYAPAGVYGDVARPAEISFPEGGRDYLTEKDIAGPQFQSLRVLFDLIDRDADGKLSRAEFNAFVKLQQSFTKLPLSLVYSAQTPSLFQVLDENGDGRLSAREARNAWTRLIVLEPVEKDFVTRAALQPQGALRFGRTSEVFAFNPTTMYTQQPIRQTDKGPVWFRKFDRNGDGELSRAEFPGTRAEFDRIDTDHDGYISLQEAEVADKLDAGQEVITFPELRSAAVEAESRKSPKSFVAQRLWISTSIGLSVRAFRSECVLCERNESRSLIPTSRRGTRRAFLPGHLQTTRWDRNRGPPRVRDVRLGISARRRHADRRAWAGSSGPSAC